MLRQFLFLSFFIFLFTACSGKELATITYKKTDAQISYKNEVKPILDNRCVTCHSCYNAPCQLKLSSYEGLDRGATKIDMYANRFEAIEPTRLFEDAKNTQEWREKGFYSVTEEFTEGKNDSIMMQFLNQKNLYPKSKGIYNPETQELQCAKDKSELRTYMNKNPHKGMPYGMPKLSKKEYNTIANWIAQGSVYDNKVKELSIKEKSIIERWETFFNNPNLKNQVSTRYIYEHIYLAHLKFDGIQNRFFKIVRSRTPMKKPIDVLPTRLVFNKPQADKFYYRLQEITSTLVHKTHMVYHLNDKKMKRYQELFINTPWQDPVYMPSYETAISSNGLKSFKQIPAKSRYMFLLDDPQFFIMTFIRGPVCRGQVALNVINDHFWVYFLDPKYDLSIKDPFFLHDNLKNLSIPNEKGPDSSLVNSVDVFDYEDDSVQYYENRSRVYKRYYPNGLSIDSIWKSPHKINDSVLTIYRHFDSATVLNGAWGDTPKTMWVIDYPLFERIYYSLVAGYDVFGNLTQGLLVRKYMDRLRVEGESNFLEYLPKDQREKTFQTWNKGWLANNVIKYKPSDNQTGIKFKSKKYKKEFSNNLFQYTNMKTDPINFITKNDEKSLFLPKEYKSKKDIDQAFRYLSKNNSIIKKITSYNANLAYIKITLNNQSYIYTSVINRWHDNVAFLYNEDNRLNPKKDTIDFIDGFVGSYPNYFFVVKEEDIIDFMDLYANYDGSETYNKKLLKYGINRARDDFWVHYDWFQKEFFKRSPIKAGLFDLNRYYEEAI